MGLWLSTAVVWLVACVVLAVLPVVVGVGFGEAAGFSVAVTAMAVPFGLLWVGLRGRAVSAFEMLGMGFAVAFCVSGVVLVAGASVGVRGVPWFVVCAVGVVVVIVGWRFGFRIAPPLVTGRQVVGAVVAVVLGAALLVVQIQNTPVFPDVPIDEVERDIYLNAAVGDAVARNGVFGSGVLFGVGARYHWLTYAWSAWLASQIGATSIEVTVRMVPFVALIIVSALASGWLMGRVKSGFGLALGAAGVVVGAPLDFGIQGRFLIGSQSQVMGVAVLFAVLVAVCAVLVTKKVAWLLVVLAVLSVALMATKVSLAAMACWGVVAIAVGLVVVHRGSWRRALVVAVMVCGVSGAAFFLVAYGNSASGGLEAGGVGFRVSGDARDVVYGFAVAASLAMGTQIAKWLGVGYLVGSKNTRDIIILAWGVSGIVFAGLGFVLLGGVGNELWFIEAGSIAATMASAFAVGRFLDARQRQFPGASRIPLIGVVAVGSASVVALVWIFKSLTFVTDRPYLAVIVPLVVLVLLAGILGRSRYGNLSSWREVLGTSATIGLAAVVLMPFSVALSGNSPSGRISDRPAGWFFGSDALLDLTTPDRDAALRDAAAAALWLRENAQPTDVVATAVPTTTWLPALTGLDMYATNPELISLWLPRGSMTLYASRQERVREYLSNPSSSLRTELCRDGVRWIWHGAQKSLPESQNPSMYQEGSILIQELC